MKSLIESRFKFVGTVSHNLDEAYTKVHEYVQSQIAIRNFSRGGSRSSEKLVTVTSTLGRFIEEFLDGEKVPVINDEAVLEDFLSLFYLLDLISKVKSSVLF